MHILFLDWECFGKTNAIATLKSMGHDVFLFRHKDFDTRLSKSFSEDFDIFVETHQIDLCFSFNYSVVLSESAKKHNLPYIAFVYDSPHIVLYSYTVINPNNYIFLFDSHECQKLQSMGISTVHYMPLPVNAKAIDTLLAQPYDKDKLSAEVSFVGALYNEKNTLFDRLDGISTYAKGYINGLMQAQMQISGYNFIEETLPPDIVSEIQNIFHHDNSKLGVETLEYVFSNYVINRKITQLERKQLLSAVANFANLRLYTLNPNADIPNATIFGPISYTTEMPLLFHNSKINLNISLRSIQSGIPLRCMDILGAGGFLLTNFQSDLLEHFVPDEDFVYYENERDLLHKIDYYLSHEEKRLEIARNGHQKVLANHNFYDCFKKIFSSII